MNLLMLSMERDLFRDTGAKNSARERMLEYAKHFSNVFIIVHSLKKHGLKPTKIGKNIYAIPTDGYAIFDSLVQMYLKGSKICQKEGIDVITSQDPFALGLIGYLLGKRHGIPLAVSVFSSFFDNEYWINESWVNRILHPLGKFVVRHATRVRVECKAERKKMQELGVKNIDIAPVITDLSRFKKASGAKIRREYLGKNFDRIVLYIGRLSPEKDIQTLLRAVPIVLKTNPRTLFLIVGGGPTEGSLKSLVEELGIKNNVHFTGKVDYSLIPEFHKAADVFVLPSIYEGIPLVLVESHAAGKPVVTTDYRDAYDVVVEGKSGFIVKQKDHQSMAEKISYILSHPFLAKKMGKVGRGHVAVLFNTRKNLAAVIKHWKTTAAARMR